METSSHVAAFRSACLDVLFSHQTHHLIPQSGKVVIFDATLPAHAALAAMLTHDINCAPVWDSVRRRYIGMLSVSDFLDILLATASDNQKVFAALSAQRLCDWAAFKREKNSSINRLLCISPESTLHEAVRQLLNYRVHRLCIVQLALPDTILRILTNHSILRFLRANCPALNTVTVRELGIGVFRELLTLTYDTPVVRALELLNQYKISSIPIVDAEGRAVDFYSRSDVKYLAMDSTWTNLSMTIKETLSSHQSARVLPQCTRDDTLMTVSGLLVATEKHSLICVHAETGIVEGVVSLTDIFSFVLNSSVPNAESRIATLRAEETDENQPDNESSTLNENIRELRRRGLATITQTNLSRQYRQAHNENAMSDDFQSGQIDLTADSEMRDETSADIPADEDFLR